MRIVGSALTLSGKTTLSRLLLRLADPTDRIAEHGARLALAADPRSRFARLLASNQAVAA